MVPWDEPVENPMGDCGPIIIKQSRHGRRKAAAEQRKTDRRFKKALAEVGYKRVTK